MFTEDDIVYSYTRRQALEDGEQIDASSGVLLEISRQHYKYPVYLTRSVWDLICQAVASPEHLNDLGGVFHDILWMSRHGQSLDEATTRFKVIITGTGRRRYHTMIAQCGAIDIDNPAPCITLMLPEDL